MSDERPGEPGADDVGADTEKFRLFMRDGEQLEQRERQGSGFRLVTLGVGLVVLAGILYLLLR